MNASALTRQFLAITIAIAFLSLMFIAGFTFGGNPRAACWTIATVIKVAGLCEKQTKITMGNGR